MRILANYIGSNLLKGIFTVTILLLGIDLFIYFVNELRLVGIGNYHLLTACCFVILTIPRKLYIIAPWGVLIGTLITLGSMAKYHELLFIRSIGVSVNKIALYAISYVFIFTILIFILGELLAPKIELFAQNRKTLALSKGNAIYTSLGTWVRNKNKFIHVTTVKKDNTLKEVTIYQLDQNFKIINSMFADSVKLLEEHHCQIINKECNSLWELTNVTVTDLNNLLQDTLDPKQATNVEFGGTIKLQKLPKLQVKNLLDLNILRAANVKHLERLSIINLAKIIRDRINNGLTIVEYKIAYWKKLMQPFSILIMGYLAVPFVIGPLRAASKGAYLLTGVSLGIGFYLLNAFLTPLVSVMGFPPSIAVIFPPMIYLTIAIYLTSKI